MKIYQTLTVFLLLILPLKFLAAQENFSDDTWPKEITTECKPGAYWWWMGNAVDPESLTWNIQQAAENGMGLLHIIPIYGVQGNEKNEISFMSPQWLEMLNHTVQEGARLGVDINMTLGTGWCFGGPGVVPEDSVTSGEVVRTENGFDVKLARDRIKVKRAAPGGEGSMLDPFSTRAMANYLQWFDEKLKGYQGAMPKAVYHDSFEYYGATWSDGLYERFEQLNGYRLQDNLDIFLSDGTGDGEKTPESEQATDRARRIKADYRRTLAEMHYDFIKMWVNWAHERGMLTRNEAHGSPSNLIDVYALSDMPEPECFNKDKEFLMTKFSSSAAHLANRKWVTSEMGTWLDQHFHEQPAALKVIADGMILSGVNRAIFHGCVYSPKDAPWPGWCFYASTELNPRNTLWKAFGGLFAYVGRIQSYLQDGTVDNDALLYWSPEDVWYQKEGLAINFTVHSTKEWFHGTPTEQLGKKLWNQGISFDYVSDKWLKNLTVQDGRIYSGVNFWKALIVPAIPMMDIESFTTIRDLAEAGATVLFEGSLPADVPGFGQLAERRAMLNSVRESESLQKCVVADAAAEIRHRFYPPTEIPWLGSDSLNFVSRKLENGYVFFVSNIKEDISYNPENLIEAKDSLYRLPVPANQIVLLNPMSGAVGVPDWKNDTDNGFPVVRLQLGPNESVLIRTFDRKPEQPIKNWLYFDVDNTIQPTELTGTWKVDFISGGPTVPASLEMGTLKSWTEFGEEYERFSGTACYRISFDLPDLNLENSDRRRARISFGQVGDAIRVTLNGQDLGYQLMPPIAADFPASLLKNRGNTLELEISNLSANRIRYMDQNGIPWKIFKDINVVSPNYKPLNAVNWEILPSGLLGPVTLEFSK
ncbi:MAG: hypothetical protein IKW74_06965 [Thermoguttaceae bacterium]|nr:hypothetical protein [Thermoguttaceae bacterium]